jgi:hypothetical protein
MDSPNSGLSQRDDTFYLCGIGPGPVRSATVKYFVDIVLSLSGGCLAEQDPVKCMTATTPRIDLRNLPNFRNDNRDVM